MTAPEPTPIALRLTGQRRARAGNSLPGPGYLALLVMLSAILLLAGCASGGSAMARYTLPLDPLPAAQRYPDNPLHTVVLEPVRLAGYLNSEGIVMQLSDIEVQQARNHLWAESLQRQLERSLQQQLSVGLADARVVRDPSPDAQSVVRVQVEVEAFQGRYDGQALVRGEWQIRDRSGQLLAWQPFNIERALASDGYPSLVRSLAQAWRDMAAELAAAVTEELAQRP